MWNRFFCSNVRGHDYVSMQHCCRHLCCRPVFGVAMGDALRGDGKVMNADLEIIRGLLKQNREIMDEIAYVYQKLEKMDNNLIVNFFDRENDYVDA